jgi:hypothetical protein
MAIGGYKEKPMFGGYHNFMIPVRFSFHKVIYKRARFSPQKNLKFKNRARVSTFFLKLTSPHNASF